MIVVHVNVHVKEEYLDAFIQATIENARSSIQEPGIARFDFVQQIDDPTHFVLIEVYVDSQAPSKHKETQHYALWRDTVAEMMAVPRTSKKYTNLFPDDQGWG